MDLVSESLSAALWLAEDIVWIVMNMFQYGFRLIWEAGELLFLLSYRLLNDIAPDVLGALYTTAEYGLHVGTILVQWVAQCFVLFGSLLLSCGQFILSLPWVAMVTTTFQFVCKTLTSTVSLLYRQGQYTFGLVLDIKVWNILSGLLKMYAILVLIIVTVAIYIYVTKYHKRNNTSPWPVTVVSTTDAEHRRPQEDHNNGANITHTTPNVAADGTDSGEIRNSSQELHEGEHLRRRVSQLSDELSRERDKNACVVCLDAKRDVLVKPCKHFCLCSSCARPVQNCPICNGRISSSERIFNA